MFTSPSVRTRRRAADSRAQSVEQLNSQRQSLECSQEFSQDTLPESSQEQTAVFNSNDDDMELTQESLGESEQTLLRGDRHAVFEVGAMPPAARQLLASGDDVSCGLSSVAQFAFVATTSTCVVWSFAAGSKAAVHRLAMPDAGEGAGAPAVALVAGVGAGDVGVVAVGGLGHVRYWDRVVFGLGGASQFHSAALPLGPADRCEQITSASTGLFVVATRNGNLFGLALQTAQGAAGLDVRALSRTAGSRAGVLSRMASLLGGSSGDGGLDDQLVSVACGGRTEIRHSREVFVLTRNRLAKWVASSAHPERLAYTIDLHHALSDSVARALGSDAELHFYDVASAGSDVCVLASAGPNLAIAVLRAAHVSSEPSAVGLTLLRYTAPHPLLQSGAGRPRLVVPAGGSAMFVALDQVVVAAALPMLGSSFEETVTLRYGDSVLAAAAIDDQQAESSVLLACRRAGILRMTASVRQGPDSGLVDADMRIGRPQQEQIEQAVFFGSDAARNPLSFSITSDSLGLDAHLQAAALRVSHAILDGSSRFVADRLDIGALLRERLRRAHAVTQALADNGLAEKLSPAARAQLCANAEKLAAAQALWDLQNAAWARTGPAMQLLANLAAAFLESTGQQQQSRDPLRLFFRLHCAAIGDLLALMHRRLPALTRALAVSPSGVKDSQIVSYEASRITTAVLQPALAYRFQYVRLYAVGDPAPERWTEHPAIADLLADRLDASYTLCRDLSAQHCQALYERITATALPGDERSDGHALGIYDDAVSISHADLSSSDDDDALRSLANATDDDPHTSPLALLRETIDQVGPLANLCFRVFVDRIARLTAAASATTHDLVQRYDTLRPRFLLCLVPLGRAPVAFRLAEEYRDLASLVTLVFVADPANAAAHLRRYVERFSKDFADTVFAFYERRSAWASLLHSQDDRFDLWLKEYIDMRIAEDPHCPLAAYSWIHDIKIADFSAVATRLVSAARKAEDVDQAQTMLSLSKLAFVVSESQSPELDDTVEARTRLDKALELCQIQAGLLHYFTMLLGSSDSKSDDRKAAYDIALHTTTPELRHRHPALYIVFSELVRRMWNHRALPAEDLIDVLTIPDSLYSLDLAASADAGDQDMFSNIVARDRFSVAADILCWASFGLPEQTRESALRSIWRRVFLSDNWSEIRRKITGDVPDSVLRSELLNTTLYQVLYSCWVSRKLSHPEWYLLPADSFSSPDLDYLVSTRLMPQFGPDSANGSGAQLKPLSTTTALALTNDYADEDKHLQAAIDCGLDGFYSEILRIVVEQASSPLLGDDEVFASDGESDNQMDTD
ncbi:hypothetical protein GGH91_000932 [Coemansia sp. RSA 2671]|nr:hypothetical protein LPJ60_001240 [Coemansia sp. RSA 2675]KAJ2349228.1 hypothetical protein GGH91_000932 [Coemansia sp. RSA 2671]